MEEKPNYYAIIPAEIRYDKTLKDKAKLLYGEISSLCGKDGYCYATNNYFAELYSTSSRTIRDLIKSLIDNGYIRSEIVFKEGTKEVAQRRLYLWKKSSIPMEENFHTPMEEIFQENNKDINKKESNNINIITKERKRFIKPKVEEVRQYATEKNIKIDADYFIDYYESKGWLVGKTPMKDWKATVRNWGRKNKNDEPQKEQTDSKAHFEWVNDGGSVSLKRVQNND